jgi:hypothetical protein
VGSACGDSTSDSSKICVGPKGFVKIRRVLKKRKAAVERELLLILQFLKQNYELQKTATAKPEYKNYLFTVYELGCYNKKAP